MDERNPSPPREFEDEAVKFRQDVIGDTTISKKWVYSVLVSMCKEIESHRENNETNSMDISGELQDEMCRLWDLCVEKDVACFLAEASIVSIFCSVISHSESPRLTEIIVGTLGNVACTSEACHVISENENFRTIIFDLLSCRDSPTLVEVGRLVNTCLQDTKSKDIWLDFVEENISLFLGDIIFILNSSTNGSVLKNILEMLDICADTRDGILDLFVDKEFILSIIEAGHQIFEENESLASMNACLHILYLITTSNKNPNDLLKANSKVFGLVLSVCSKYKIMDDFNIEEDNPSPAMLASCLSIINFMLYITHNCGESIDFLDDIPTPQKDMINALNELVVKECKALLGADTQSLNRKSESIAPATYDDEKSVSKDDEYEQSDSAISREVGNNKASENNVSIKGVPLLDIANDLSHTLRKIGWVE